MLIKPGKLLAKINHPDDLKNLDRAELPELCKELRQYIVDSVSQYGGHFGASLGVVELSVALHYVLNTPDDKLIWDVGHQAYGHKILTGRRDLFHTNRVFGGISGFPNMKESEFDAFGVGHSSTSISAALGMAESARLQNDDERMHVAVIGDGAMTAGMAFEAMNQAGVSNTNLLIILNDNCMSIDPNVGALRDYLTDITTSRTYNKLKDEVWNMLSKLSKFGRSTQEIVQKFDRGLKSTLLKHSNLFESLKLRYFGPLDGHDIDHLISVIDDLKKIPGPKILHCLTTKGKGYEKAELDQTRWHAPGKFNKDTGEIIKTDTGIPEPPKYQDVFGNTLVELADKNEKIVGITPAMPSGSSMKIMMDAYPDRSYDVGIAEQHAVTFSAGLAADGMIPFCNIYSTFMQRAYDQVIHDVCIQNLPVVFCMDRAGFAGADGATHHGAYDIAFMRCIPNLVVSAPMDEHELRNLMYTAQSNPQGPYSIRYPRGNGVHIDWKQPMKLIKTGTGRVIHEGSQVAILSFGHIGNEVTTAREKLLKEGINPGHYDMRFVKPLDEKLLHKIMKKYEYIITVEDGCLQGGFGSAILEFMAENNYTLKVKRLGIPDAVFEHGTQQQLQHVAGFDAEGIADATIQLLAAAPTTI